MTPLLSGEFLKILRQPWVLFWGFLFVPAFALLVRFLLEGFVYMRSGQFSAADADLALSAAKTLSFSGNALAHLFYAIGIGTIFVTEYRTATWRLLIPRCRRPAVLAAKVITCMLLVAIGLLLAVAGDMALTAGFSVLSGKGLGTLTVSASGSAVLLGAYILAAVELTVLILLVGGLTIITRSLIGPVILPFALALFASMLQLYLGADAMQLPLSSYAAETVRNWLLDMPGSMPPATGMLVLGLWLAGLATLTGLAFGRQEFSSE